MILFILIIGCNPNDDDTQYNAYHYGNALEFRVLDSSNNDLLDPDTPGAFDKKDIKLYYLVDGEKQEVFDGRLDHPRNFAIYNRGEELNNSDGHIIRIVTNISESDTIPITYIQWNEKDTDTIKCEYVRTQNTIWILKAWYNDKLLTWDGPENTAPYYEIVK